MDQETSPLTLQELRELIKEADAKLKMTPEYLDWEAEYLTTHVDNDQKWFYVHTTKEYVEHNRLVVQERQMRKSLLEQGKNDKNQGEN